MGLPVECASGGRPGVGGRLCDCLLCLAAATNSTVMRVVCLIYFVLPCVHLASNCNPQARIPTSPPTKNRFSGTTKVRGLMLRRDRTRARDMSGVHFQRLGVPRVLRWAEHEGTCIMHACAQTCMF
eukprot:363688-Chlamydomonas_euryale.AAC.4